MKPFLLNLLCSVLFLSQLSSLEDNPEYRLENLPAADDSIQQCLVFRSIAGVLHTVQISENLIDWEPYEAVGEGGRVYGLGGEIAVPLRQFTPPPPAPPGGGGGTSEWQGSPARNVSVMLRPATGGGTVASWRSLDREESVTVLLEEDLHEDWEHMPLFWNRYDGYHVFIWRHRIGVAAPPAEETPLSPADGDFRDVLAQEFPGMNTQVAAAAAVARNAPPPAPPAPGSRKFLRIASNHGIDSDGDGIPDWIEFAMMNDSEHPDHAFGNPFDADVNGDGAVDGTQTDFDRDGTVNAVDVAVGDGTVSATTASEFRYAFFPIDNAPSFENTVRALQINETTGDRCSFQMVSGAAASGWN